MFIYTKKGEVDGLGKAGREVSTKKVTLAYLQLHGYCEEGKAKPKPETGAVAGTSTDGAVRRGRKVRT